MTRVNKTVLVLVAPDGKIVARDMHGPFIMKAVEKALEKAN